MQDLEAQFRVMGYNVHPYPNLSKVKFLEQLASIQNMIETEHYDRLVLIVLSHGEKVVLSFLGPRFILCVLLARTAGLMHNQ